MKTRFLILLIVGSLMVVACGGKTQPAAAPEEELPEIAPAEPVTEAGEQEISTCALVTDLKPEWRTVLCETFDDNAHGWYTGEGDSERMTGESKLENGEYIVDYTGKAFAQYSKGGLTRLPIIKSSDFLVSVTGLIETVNRELGWGIGFHFTDNSEGYLFRIGQEGYYSLYKVAANAATPLVQWKTNSAIQWEEENTLVVIAENDQFEFYVNGTLLTTYSDSEISGDNVYLIFWLAEGASAVYTMDDILVKIP
jgi:hypothetical protein